MLRTGKPLSVELGPGIMGSIFDGEYLRFLVHLVINQRALYNHALSIVRRRPASASASVLVSVLSVHTSSSHRVRHRNFIFQFWYTYAHMPPIYAHKIFSDSDL